MKKLLGNNMHEARKRCGIPRRELVKRSGISDTRIRMFEAGEACPSLQTAIRLAKCLGLGLDEYLGLESITAPEWKMYEKQPNGEYRYGPEWQAMALWVDGGFKSPEEAKAAWLLEEVSG